MIALSTVLPLILFALVYQPARENLRVFLLAAPVVAAGALVVTALGKWTISRRMEKLNTVAKQFGEGNFRARVAKDGDNYISRLGVNLNQLAEKLEERENHFTELDRLKSEFVSNVSHELRTPLTTIKALTRLLMREELTDEKRREYLETVSVECDRQIDLVLNLLDLSRIEGGVFRLSLERVDVADIIHSCVKAEKVGAEKRRHTLQIKPFAKILLIRADPKALRRVVSNLIENSIKYTPDGGLITLSAAQEDDFVIIRVMDNGRGIPPDDIPRLFDKFHRGLPATHSEAMRKATENVEFLEDADVSGIGLGLYLARNVIEQMNGFIGVETEVGLGSTFTLHLPVWKEAGYDKKSIEERESV